MRGAGPRPGAAAALWPWALLVAVTAGTYASSLANGFVWDDEVIVVHNPDLRDLSQLGKVLLSPDETRPYYRPLSRASYFLDYRLFGLDPRGFHTVNVAIHAANALALFGVGRRLFGHPLPALLAALLLAVHPLHSEPVNFVTARNNLLALLFSLLALGLLIDASRSRSAWRVAGSSVAFLLGLASKEQALAVLPLMVAWLVLPGAARGAPRLGRVALLAPHVALLAAYLALRRIALDGLAEPVEWGGLGSRLAENLVTIPGYLWLVVFPRDLTIFHVVSLRDAGFSWWVPLAWGGLAAGIAAHVRSPSRASTVGWLWLGFNVLPIAGIVPIPSAAFAERYVYVPAVGLWWLVADAAWRAWRATGRKPLLASALLVVLAALAGRTLVRNLDWRDDVTLAAAAVRVTPGHVQPHLNLAVALKDRGDLDGARRHWETALRLEPDNAEALTQLGTLAAVSGDLAGAEPLLRRALARNPRLAVAHLNLARICERTGRPQEALDRYEAFLRLAGAAEAPLVPSATERVQELRRQAR